MTLYSISTWYNKAKRDDVKECATRGVPWVNLKFKDRNLIDASLYTYLCTAICIATCISADGCILWQAYGLAKTKANNAKKSSHSYSSCWPAHRIQFCEEIVSRGPPVYDICDYPLNASNFCSLWHGVARSRNSSSSSHDGDNWKLHLLFTCNC